MLHLAPRLRRSEPTVSAIDPGPGTTDGPEVAIGHVATEIRRSTECGQVPCAALSAPWGATSAGMRDLGREVDDDGESDDEGGEFDEGATIGDLRLFAEKHAGDDADPD